MRQSVSVRLVVSVVALAAGAIAHAAPFVDDAGRSVELPQRVGRVFAAGAPAEVLLFGLVPEMLVGRNHQPSPEALALLPERYRDMTPIMTLPERDEPRYDAELAALAPDVYVDYGTVSDDYVEALEAITARLDVPGIILDGKLENVPAVYRRLGAAFGVAQRGEVVAAVTERILAKYRNALAARPVRVYLACSGNGLTPCLEGHAFGEAAAWLGVVNVAGNVATAPRRAWTQDEIRSAAPDVLVVADAARIRNDAAWLELPAVAAGRVHAPPTLPYNWGPRPPSVNRLLGLVWLAYVLPGRDFDAEFYADVGALYAALYGVELGESELRRLVTPP